MIRVTLRYKFVWAMFMSPWSGARPPIREAIIKMCTYHLDRVPWSLAKKHSPLCIFFKKSIERIFSRIQLPDIRTKARQRDVPSS